MEIKKTGFRFDHLRSPDSLLSKFNIKYAYKYGIGKTGDNDIWNCFISKLLEN